ncbi:MAG: methyltransferase domain-containing protein [Micromonosporaceae bacterium]
MVQADFETAPLPPGPYDPVVSATAFHWLDPAAALPKIAGVLDGRGGLVVWWTVFGDPQRPTPFRSALDRPVRPLAAA